MNLISGVNVTASALNAEQVRMDVVAENIANAYTTKGPDGQAYQRKTVSFEAMLQPAMDGTAGTPGQTGAQEVRVSQIGTDTTPGPTVYEPGNPDANKEGMVELPNVNLSTEMVDLMTASRAYEANLAVIRNARQMAAKALTIGH